MPTRAAVTVELKISASGQSKGWAIAEFASPDAADAVIQVGHVHPFTLANAAARARAPRLRSCPCHPIPRVAHHESLRPAKRRNREINGAGMVGTAVR